MSILPHTLKEFPTLYIQTTALVDNLEYLVSRTDETWSKMSLTRCTRGEIKEAEEDPLFFGGVSAWPRGARFCGP